MKLIILLVVSILCLPAVFTAQTAQEWLEQAAEAEAEAQTAEAEGRTADAQNAWREAAAARANAAEKQVENGEYEKAAENYEKAAEQFEKAGNKAQADTERIKASSNYDTAANEAQDAGNQEEADRLRQKAKAIKDAMGGTPGPITETKPTAGKNPDVVTTATGTGWTTGHIGTIRVTNKGKDTLYITPQTVYIPSDGKHQSYVGRIPPGIAVPPGATVDVPVYGYCVDVTRPPVPGGVDMPPLEDWVPVTPTPPAPSGPGISRPPGTGEQPPSEGDDGPFVSLVPKDPLPFFTPEDIPGIQNNPGFTETPPEGNTQPDLIPTWPGTDIPVNGTIDPEKDPDAFAPVIVSIVEHIENAVTVIQDNPVYQTPFSPDPVKEAEAIGQQTVWISMGDFTGEPYGKEDFAENVYEQFVASTGVPISTLPREQKEQLDGGVGQFWTVFLATGVEAKVLKEDPAGVTISEETDPPPPEGKDDPPPPEKVTDGTCGLIEDVRDSGVDLDYAIARTGTEEINEEVKEAFRAAIEEVAGIISDAKGSDTIDIEFTTPELPASAWSLYFPHIVAGRANASAFAVNTDNPLKSAWTTEPLKTEASGTHKVVLTHLLEPGCKSTLIGVNLAKIRATSEIDNTVRNVEILEIMNFVGEVAMDIVLKKGKGTFKKLSKYLKEKAKDMAKDKAKEWIKEELKRLGQEMEDMSEEEAEQTMDELLEKMKEGKEWEEEEEEGKESEFLEDWLAEILVEGDEFDPMDKIESETLDKVDSPIDWSPIKTHTYALNEGSLEVIVNGDKDKARTGSGVSYKREEFESEEEAVKGGGVKCEEALASDISSGSITLVTNGETLSQAGATGEGIISTGHGVATATLESFNGMYVIAICECPKNTFYDTFSSATGYSTEEIMTGVWIRVFENLMGDVVKKFDEDLGKIGSPRKKVSQEMVDEVKKGIETAAARAAQSILACRE